MLEVVLHNYKAHLLSVMTQLATSLHINVFNKTLIYSDHFIVLEVMGFASSPYFVKLGLEN